MAGATSSNSIELLQIVNSQKIICPSREELQIEHGDYVCPSEGCDKVFQASSQLQMHLTRHHHGQTLSGAGGSLSRDCVYYCPVEGCPRSKANNQPFPRLGQLKQVCTTIIEFQPQALVAHTLMHALVSQASPFYEKIEKGSGEQSYFHLSPGRVLASRAWG